MIVTRAPGKLYIAGEYAVVDPGGTAVVVAVDRYLTVTLTESTDAGRVHSEEYGRLPLVWTFDSDASDIVPEHRPHDYVVAAISTMERLRAEREIAPRYFDLSITSELDDTRGRKFGLGSSAAVTVAVVAALDEFYGLSLSTTDRFKLALLATVQVSPRASGGDLAASTFGGWLHYSAPDRTRLLADFRTDGPTRALTSAGWDSFSAVTLPPPSTVSLVVGWTGSPASTERLVDGVRRPRHPADPFTDFPDVSRSIVDRLVEAIRRDDAAEILIAVRAARRTLQRLGDATGIEIETPALRRLCDIAEGLNAAAKPSGAGGGDCGIVMLPNHTALDRLIGEWPLHGITHLDLAVDPPHDPIEAPS